MKTKIKFRQSVFALLVITALFLGACGGAAEPQVVVADMNDAVMREGEMMAEEPAMEIALEEAMPANAAGMDKDGSGFNSSIPAKPNRMIVMNANLNLIVESPADVMNFVAEMAVEYGGFVVNSDLGQAQGQYGSLLPFATITVRVPAAKLNQALAEIEGLAHEVVTKNQSGQDVTSDYTDLQSRLRNLERAEEQLSQVMAEAHRTEDVLMVYNELTQVTEQIEVIKGQMKYYEEASSFSAISLTLHAIEIPPPTPAKPKWQPSEAVQRALADLKVRAQFWADQAIRFMLYRLPLMVLSLWPYALVGWLLYRWFGRKWFKTKKQEPAPAD